MMGHTAGMSGKDKLPSIEKAGHAFAARTLSFTGSDGAPASLVSGVNGRWGKGFTSWQKRSAQPWLVETRRGLFS